MRSLTWAAGNESVTIAISDRDTSAQVRATIQGALDAAARAAAASGMPATVTLSAGLFVIDGDGHAANGGLRVGSNVTFAGTLADGVKQSVIKLDEAYTSAAVTGIVRTENAPGVHNVTVKNLVIQGNGAGNPKNVDGIYAGHAPGRAPDPALAQRDIVIDNVEVSNCSRYGIDPHEQIANLTIRNSTAFNNGVDGFTLDYIQGGVIENNIAHDNGRHGFNVVTGSHDLVLKDNQAYRNGGNGLVIQPPSQGDGRGLQSFNIKVSGGEYAANLESGIKINSARDVSVEGAYVHDNAQHGIRVGIASWNPGAANYPPPASERVVIAGNRIADNGTPGAAHAEIDLKATGDARVEAVVQGNQIGSETSPARYEIKASANVAAAVNGNRYSDGAATVSGLTIGDNPIAASAIRKVALTGGGDTFTSDAGRQYVEGLGGDDIIATGAGKDTLLGGAGNDRLSGGSGNDVLIGGEGNDRLDGGSGSDWMSGGLGDDTYLVQSTGDSIVELAGGGVDTVFSSVTWSLLNAQELENLTLTGTAAIRAAGNQNANTLTGNAAANTLSGGAGNDILNGMAGADRLMGDAGRDVLTGGLGNDTFDFTALTDTGLGLARDVITDFSQAPGNRDTINLMAIDANSTIAGNQAFAWIGTEAFTRPGQLRYHQSGGVTVIQASTDADGEPEFEIQLTGLPPLSAADLIL